MSAFPPPTNGYFNGATYNSAYFVDSNSNTVTKDYLQENYLPRVGNPIDAAETTTFEGDIIFQDGSIVFDGQQGDQYIQWPNGSKQYTAMNDLVANQTLTYATVTTDQDGVIKTVTAGTGEFETNITLIGMQGQYIMWPNGTKQQTAMNDLVANQTYTNATITTDAYGVIKTLATGTLPTTTIPVKVASAYGTYSSSYTSFTINTNGSTSGAWAQNQFFTIRYTISTDYNASTSSPYQFQSNGTATGTMDIYPYRFGTNWCSNSNAPALAQLPNSINGNSSYNMVNTGTTPNGGVIAPSGRQFWSYGAALVGTNSYYLHGTMGSIVFQLVNPSGWSSGASFTYSIEIELLYTGANAASITTSGFNQNF